MNQIKTTWIPATLLSQTIFILKIISTSFLIQTGYRVIKGKGGKRGRNHKNAKGVERSAKYARGKEEEVEEEKVDKEEVQEEEGGKSI